MTTTTHPLAEEYLHRLDRCAKVLPRHEREELTAEIRSHLHLGLKPDASEAEVRNFLDELGEPEGIVAAAEPGPPPTRRGAREVFALILLVTGFPPILGWLVGVALLVLSLLWTWRQKLLGILIWPGGYTLVLGALGVMAAGGSGVCLVQSTAVAGAVVVEPTSTGCGPPAPPPGPSSPSSS